MIVDLIRYNSEDDYTDGMFLVDGKFICYDIEDERRTKKVYGETCIPEGEYEIVLRTSGRFHENYTRKFGDWHKGMLCITNAPNYKIVTNSMTFQYVLIHIGNDDDDTAGCPLTGMNADGNDNKLANSTEAYKVLYPIIRDELLKGNKVKIRIQYLPEMIGFDSRKARERSER